MEKKKLILWGGTGQSIMLEETLRKNFRLEALFDNNPIVLSPFKNVPIHHGWNAFLSWGKHKDLAQYYFMVAIGGEHGKVRLELHSKLKSKGLPWEKAKAFDGAAVIGKWLPKIQFADINNINFSLKKNEEQVQTGNTRLMLWKINELIEYVSKYFTLKIGDIIFTGTPAGVGKVFANDQLKGYIEDQEIFSIKIK